VYFVAETKSTTVQADRREAENLKIICAREHFGLGDEVFFDDVTKLSELLA
jgi:type III restriction enzyme